MVSGFDPKGPRDAVFVPVGINYDRVIEDRVQLGALATKPDGEKPRFKFAAVLARQFSRQHRAAAARASCTGSAMPA